MHTLTIEATLVQRPDALIVSANDAEQRRFVGVGRQGQAARDFLFVEIDRVTLLEMQRGLVEPHTAAMERAAGLVLRARGHGAPEEVLDGVPVPGFGALSPVLN